MTIPTRADFAKIDAYENIRRMSRYPWSVKPEGTKPMKQILFLALFAVAVFAFGCWYFQDACWLGDVSK